MGGITLGPESPHETSSVPAFTSTFIIFSIVQYVYQLARCLTPSQASVYSELREGVELPWASGLLSVFLLLVSEGHVDAEFCE